MKFTYSQVGKDRILTFAHLVIITGFQTLWQLHNMHSSCLHAAVGSEVHRLLEQKTKIPGCDGCQCERSREMFYNSRSHKKDYTLLSFGLVGHTLCKPTTVNIKFANQLVCCFIHFSRFQASSCIYSLPWYVTHLAQMIELMS